MRRRTRHLLRDSVRVLFENEQLLAVFKPSGVLVHRGWADDGPILADEVRDYLSVAKVHPLHRIDRGCSGVVLFAKSPDDARAFGAAFHDGGVAKSYLALVRGIPKSVEGVIDHPIPRTEGGDRVASKTEWALVENRPTEPRAVSLVRAKPITGRLHQVRRHLKHINHPLIGDANYGKGKLNRAIRERYGLSRLALHAESLSLQVRAETIVICAPMPSDLVEPLKAMGFVLGGCEC